MPLISYELAKELKAAGFPQTGDNWNCYHDAPENINGCYVPSLSELIEACGDRFFALRRDFRADNNQPFFWAETNHATTFDGVASSTPEEAVARLYIALKG